jgi:hypothetical protein
MGRRFSNPGAELDGFSPHTEENASSAGAVPLSAPFFGSGEAPR